MAWPASQQTLSDALMRGNRTALTIKNDVMSIRNASVSSDITRRTFVTLQRQLTSAIDIFNEIKNVPGILAFAREQYDDPTLDVGTEFNAMVSAAENLRDWIFANFPTDSGSGAILAETVDSLGNITQLVFTSAQLDAFRIQADIFLGTIS